MRRLSSLDYLRGLAAFGVMVFHYSMWNFGLFNAQDFLGRVGLYGVAIFYVLSGITLYHVYFNKIGTPSKTGLKDFAIKRIFRIFPLLWLLSFLTLVIKKDVFTSENIFLNFSGLFSVYHWKESITYGGWSIANELAFYMLFPLFIFISKKSKILLSLVSICVVLIYLWFAFIRLENYSFLGEVRGSNDSWEDYTNPLNQVIFFFSGYLIGHLFKYMSIPKMMNFVLIALSLLIFIYYPAKDNSIHLITGFTRVVFTVVSIIICFAFYKTEFGLPGPVHRVFSFLGDISYALYLAHPLIWYILSVYLKKYYYVLSPQLRLIAGFIISLSIAYLLHQILEKPFMALGKKLSKK
jgi:exopolysaccharide production protein ExoZ